jgi:hypothetical protein
MDSSIYIEENRYIAKILDEVADLLQQQNASSFRVGAYRKAADYTAHSTPPLRNVHFKSSLEGLEALPTIGPSIANAVAEILETGSLATLARLRGTMDPEELFQTVPTIGPHIAQQLHDELHLETLEVLEAAALDGWLSKLKGIGPRRVSSIKASLAKILERRRPPRRRGHDPAPSMEALLEVDRDYRFKAERGSLATIKPKRFNSAGDARIPIQHTEFENWRFTALFSNSPNAHRFGRTHDWVVIYYEKDGQAEGQCTVVTEKKGPLAGKRVVRGFEIECAQIFRKTFEVA